MPDNKSLMASLQKQYGVEKGKEIYYKMEQENGPSFRKGLSTVKGKQNSRRK